MKVPHSRVQVVHVLYTIAVCKFAPFNDGLFLFTLGDESYLKGSIRCCRHSWFIRPPSGAAMKLTSPYCFLKFFTRYHWPCLHGCENPIGDAELDSIVQLLADTILQRQRLPCCSADRMWFVISACP